jgi:adenylate kinase
VAVLAAVVLVVGTAPVRATGAAETPAFAPQEAGAGSKKPLQLIIFGASGLDRGALAASLDPSLPYLSLDRMMEAQVIDETGLGRRIQHAMQQGKPVADGVIRKLVTHRLSMPDCDRGFFLDGFPRSLAQARRLTAITEELGKGEVAAVYLTLPDEILLARMFANKRTIENEEDVKERLAAYHARMAPLAEYYEERGALVRVNANRSVDVVAAEIRQALKGSR